MARLVLDSREGQQTVELRAHNSLGRHPNNTIQLLDKIVSKEHCILELRATGFVLRDLGSLNGTYVNGTRVAGERDLHHGDEISMGQTKARFEDAPAYPHPTPSQPQGVAVPGRASRPAPAPPGQRPAWPQPQSVVPASAMQAHGSGPAPYPSAPGRPGLYPSSPAPYAGAAPVSGYQAPPPPAPFPQGHAQPSKPLGFPSASPAFGQTRPSSLEPRRPPPPPPPTRAASRAFATAFLPAMPAPTTAVDQEEDQAQQIGAEIAANEADFRPYDEIAQNPLQLRADYERLRLTYELTRNIASETDLTKLLDKILQTVFKFTQAQRGVIFMPDVDGEMKPVASHREDGGRGAISVSNTIMRKVLEDRKAVITHDAGLDFAASKGKSMILHQIHSAIVAPMIHNEELFGVLWLDSTSLAQFQQKDLELVIAVASQAAMFMEINILDKQKERLSCFVSPAVAEQVISRQVDLNPGGARTECTVYNSDIRGFTRMSESTSPEAIVEMLNAYFEAMVEVIFKYDGTLDKFMGDGIMALWGSPVHHDDDPERAVECALEQTEVLGRFNRSRIERGLAPLGVGTAVHTGPLVAGYIGTKRALSYTVIGDVANTSARLCGQALAGQIVVSEDTRVRLPSRFELEELAPLRVKGKEKPMRVFNVVRSRPLVSVPGAMPPSVRGVPA
ncbi:MAG: FHA domain-containing protein [Deltaproteobacteria bacterium]|nr:FHA domain-containing protein [Deltaproteobacteria bacterium]